MQNVNGFLEKKLIEISISDEEMTAIKAKIKEFFNLIRRYFPEVRNYAFGGSFDRYTSIPHYYDIDIYWIFTNESIKLLSGDSFVLWMLESQIDSMVIIQFKEALDLILNHNWVNLFV